MKKCKKSTILVIGAIIGVVNGIFGAGAGSILVPLLVSVFGIEEKKAHATAILIILPISIASAIIYITVVGINLGNYAFAIIGVVLGGVIGAMSLKKISNSNTRKIFSGIMLLSGIWLIFF